MRAALTLAMIHSLVLAAYSIHGPVGESLKKKGPDVPPSVPGMMTFGPDGIIIYPPNHILELHPVKVPTEGEMQQSENSSVAAGRPKWTKIDLPKPPEVEVEPTYHTMENKAMGEDLRAGPRIRPCVDVSHCCQRVVIAGGRYHIDEQGNVSEEPVAPRTPLTDEERTRAHGVYMGIDLDQSGAVDREEMSAVFAASNPLEWFDRLDRIRRDGTVSLAEFLAGLPELKPQKGTQSLKFTLRHLEKRAAAVRRDDVAAARDAIALTMGHYPPPYTRGKEGGEASSDRHARYQVLLSSARVLSNIYIDISLPPGARFTEHFYYLGKTLKADTRAPATRLCPILPAGGREEASVPVVVRCHLPRLEARVGLYFHAHFPGNFTPL